MNLSEMFLKFKRSAKRLEILQEYHMDGDEWDTFQKYRNGYPTPIFNELDEWNNQIKEWSKQGKTVERIRVIDSPLTDYLKYQIDLGYLPSALCGQSVRFVSKKVFDAVNKYNIKNDIWIFDDKHAFEMIYDKNGVFIESREVNSENPVLFYNELYDSSRTLEYVIKQIREQDIFINL